MPRAFNLIPHQEHNLLQYKLFLKQPLFYSHFIVAIFVLFLKLMKTYFHQDMFYILIPNKNCRLLFWSLRLILKLVSRCYHRITVPIFYEMKEFYRLMKYSVNIPNIKMIICATIWSRTYNPYLINATHMYVSSSRLTLIKRIHCYIKDDKLQRFI